jgi:predicted nuclease of predicted toxin-antitoxin system
VNAWSLPSTAYEAAAGQLCVSVLYRRTLEAWACGNWVGDWPADPGDSEIFAHALKEGLTIVTLDKDFGELAAVFGRAHSGIIRMVNLPLAKQAAVCLAAIDQHGAELLQGAIRSQRIAAGAAYLTRGSSACCNDEWIKIIRSHLHHAWSAPTGRREDRAEI